MVVRFGERNKSFIYLGKKQSFAISTSTNYLDRIDLNFSTKFTVYKAYKVLKVLPRKTICIAFEQCLGFDFCVWLFIWGKWKNVYSIVLSERTNKLDSKK